MLVSREFYNQFSAHYRDYAKQRESYLGKVDQLLVSIGKGALSIIDIGCGYGNRSLKIAKSLGIKKVTLVDNSSGMIQHCTLDDCEQIICDITSKYLPIDKKYDMVLCLWNVLGHIDTHEKRVVALKNMKNLLNEQGRLYIDVNNRYNINQYGLFSVFRNILEDIFFFKKTGDFLLKVNDGKNILQTQVHIFTVYEMRRLFNSSGLRIQQTRVIDYQNGNENKSIFRGQLLFVVSKK